MLGPPAKVPDGGGNRANQRVIALQARTGRRPGLEPGECKRGETKRQRCDTVLDVMVIAPVFMTGQESGKRMRRKREIDNREDNQHDASRDRKRRE